VNSKRTILPSGNSSLPLSLPPPTQTVRILQPQTYFLIRVFDHPVVGQDYGSNEEETAKTEKVRDNEDQSMDVRNFVKREALKTLLATCENESDDVDEDVLKDTEERTLTELEDLDLYYDFDYDEKKYEKENYDVRKVFDSDSEDEDDNSL